MLTFKELGLSSNLLRGIEALGFEKPRPIQEQVIPEVFNTTRDIVGLAQTGTGKTAAFGLPIIERIDFSKKTVQSLILSPTRELCVQISKDLQNYGKYVNGLQVLAVYGGASIENQIKALKKGVHIIVATPGRMLDLINRKAANISGIHTLVLDEADEMLNMGFREDIDSILESTPIEKQTLLFSATMPNGVARIAGNYMHEPKEITIGQKNAGAENVRHYYYQVQASDRYFLLKRIVDINPDIYGIVFCRTRMETKTVADKLIKDGYNAESLHGDLSQSQRDQVMKHFRERSIQLLVATDVAARGIDVQDISHIINFNLPDDPDTYTHRSGRTGRGDKSGISISLANYRENNKISQIEKLVRKKIEKVPIPTGVEICKKQLFNLIDRMEKVKVDEEQIAPFMDVVNKKLDWLSKEDIIKHFVSLEFNRFLEYYKNAPDLNKKEYSGTDRQRKRKNKKNESSTAERTSRLFINVGKKDGLSPAALIGFIYDHAKNRDIRFGNIDLKDSFSFFETDTESAEQIIGAFKNKKHKGRALRVNLAKPDDGSRKKKSKKKKSRQGRL